MTYDGIAKVQHYVPQLILRNWGIGKKKQIYAFDKLSEKTFNTKVKNVAAESRFYDFEIDGNQFTIEPGLSKIETIGKSIIEKIVANKNIRAITEEERLLLCQFMAVQFARTKHIRDHFTDTIEQLKETVRERFKGTLASDEIEKSFGDMNDSQFKAMMTANVIDAPKQFAEHFANKTWMLAVTSNSHPFLIGDNPIALQNSLDLSPYGNIGLAVRGIEIYFPLNPNMAIVLWCPSHYAKLRNDRNQPLFRFLDTETKKIIESLINAIETGEPVYYSPENVLNFNHLQCVFSERFIFSNQDDFWLIKDMLKKNERYRHGPRSRIG